MRTFGLMLKSYGRDYSLAERLVASYHRYNGDSLPMVIIVPAEDVSLFQALASDSVTVMDETPFAAHLVSESFGGLRIGYINQEIVKLAFWELGVFDNYLVMDSDAVFIRPFVQEDFMSDDTTPYSVLVEDNELKTDPRYYREHWQGREVHLRRIQELVGLDDRRLLTCHNHQVFNSTVLRSLRDDFLGPRDWGYRDLIEASPYEFSWYNFWLQKSAVIPIRFREPWFKMLHHEGQHTELAIRGTTLEDLARGYVGLVVNSNFANAYVEFTLEETAEATLARYVPPATLARALARQAGESARRRLRR